MNSQSSNNCYKKRKKKKWFHEILKKKSLTINKQHSQTLADFGMKLPKNELTVCNNNEQQTFQKVSYNP
jgi:hypothetical protein